MKRKVILISLFFLLTAIMAFGQENVGDANGDGIVNIVDALYIAQYYVSPSSPPQGIVLENCDVNVDTFINIIDALVVAQYSVGLETGYLPLLELLARFTSEQELIDAFANTASNYDNYWYGPDMVFMAIPVPGSTPGPVPTSAPMATPLPSTNSSTDPELDYSGTNNQVQGVDEADIIKTDGNYVYMLTKGKLVIADSYPAIDAHILSETTMKNITPQEMFVHGDKLMLYGTIKYRFDGMYPTPPPYGYYGYYYNYDVYNPFVAVRIYDISDRANPVLLRNIELEGNYLSARKIGAATYFVINTHPNYIMDNPTWQDIVPMYRDSVSVDTPVKEDMLPLCHYQQIGYLRPMQAQQFITVASLSLDDPQGELQKQVIVGSGESVFSSLKNFYIAQTNWYPYSSLGTPYEEKTIVTKFAIGNGSIKFLATGEVPGHILNQFSMDEYDNYFRIATTNGQVSQAGGNSTNNVYILNPAMKQVGALENLAPGEKIYSVRFTGKKGYLVTFKKVDPFFVLDLSNPSSPSVLGQLKIPGYSDYLHPYDENHIIGLGKWTLASQTGDFAWYQGIKISLFDVTDPTNPVEMYQEVIGERGSSSYALDDHRAFLFSPSRNLLVLPVRVYEFLTPPTTDHTTGKPMFSGAYVYNLDLTSGFNLKGRVTHEDNPTPLTSGGYSFNYNNDIKRSLYIEDTLYTFSNNRLQLNDLNSLQRIKSLNF